MEKDLLPAAGKESTGVYFQRHVLPEQGECGDFIWRNYIYSYMHNLGMGTFLSMPSFDLNLGRKDGRHVF
jgi:hypothetical protein